MEADMIDENADLTPEQQKQIEQSKKYEQRLLNRFQMELGRLSGQAVVDRTNFELAAEEWHQKEAEYIDIIKTLTDRLESQEGDHQAQPGTEKAAATPAEAEPVKPSEKTGKAGSRT